MSSNGWLWKDFHSRFLKAVGGDTLSASETYRHLNQGYRELCALVDVPELIEHDYDVTALADADSIAIKADILHVLTITDLSTGTKLVKERNLRDRPRYLESDGIPLSGDPSFWERVGDMQLLIRDAPDSERTLRCVIKVMPEWVSVDDESGYPLTPAQYDTSLLLLAVADAYTFMPPNPETMERLGMPPLGYAAQLRSLARDKLTSNENPMDEERKDSRKFIMVRGYGMTPGV